MALLCRFEVLLQRNLMKLLFRKDSRVSTKEIPSYFLFKNNNYYYKRNFSKINKLRQK